MPRAGTTGSPSEEGGCRRLARSRRLRGSQSATGRGDFRIREKVRRSEGPSLAARDPSRRGEAAEGALVEEEHLGAPGAAVERVVVRAGDDHEIVRDADIRHPGRR